jgi:hypothetical protein
MIFLNSLSTGFWNDLFNVRTITNDLVRSFVSITHSNSFKMGLTNVELKEKAYLHFGDNCTASVEYLILSIYLCLKITSQWLYLAENVCLIFFTNAKTVC